MRRQIFLRAGSLFKSVLRVGLVALLAAPMGCGRQSKPAAPPPPAEPSAAPAAKAAAPPAPAFSPLPPPPPGRRRPPRRPVLPGQAMDDYAFGQRLSPAQARELEALLAKAPEDLALRRQLVGYYSRLQTESGLARSARQRHLLWLYEHHPETFSPQEQGLDPGLDDAVFDQARAIWLRQVKTNPKSAAIMAAAACFAPLPDGQTAEALYQRAQTLEPKNPAWPKALADLYAGQAGAAGSGTASQAAKKALASLELAQANTTNAQLRFYNLQSLTRMAFDLGDLAKARTYADDLLRQAEEVDTRWGTGDAVYRGHLVLGRIALRESNLAEAKTHLLAAAATGGSPVLGSFGPNMSLAKELLDKGEKETVLEFLQRCADFWTGGKEKLDNWIRQVQDGDTPDFGANLFY